MLKNIHNFVNGERDFEARFCRPKKSFSSLNVSCIGLIVILFLNGSIVLSRQHLTDVPDVLIEPFPIFSWVPPAINQEQLTWYRQAGFTVVTIYPDEKVYQKMREFWNGNYIVFREWSDDYSYQDMLEFRPNDENKIGYLIVDEPYYRLTEFSTHQNVLEETIKIFQMMREKDPQRISFVNLFPSFIGETRLGGSWLDYVRDYFEIMKPRYSSFDHYPLRWFDVTTPSFYYDLEIFRYFANRNNSNIIGFVQVFSRAANYRDVSESDIAWQVNTFLAYGAKGLWYFNFRHPHAGLSKTPKPEVSKDGVRDYRQLPGKWKEYYKDAYTTFGPAVLDYMDKKTEAYEYVKRINKQVAAWGPILLRLSNIAVRHVINRQPFVPVGTERFISGQEPYIRNVWAADVDEDMGFIVSYFENDEGVTYIMVVNKRHGEFMTCTGSKTETIIEFDDDVESAQIICNVTGKASTAKTESNKLYIDLDAGGAVLLRLQLSD